MSTPAAEAPNTNAWAPKRAWGQPSGAQVSPTDTTIDLNEVMSEQLASKLQSEAKSEFLGSFLGGSANAKAAANAVKDSLDLSILSSSFDECNSTTNDELLAQMLQQQYDQEVEEAEKQLKEQEQLALKEHQEDENEFTSSDGDSSDDSEEDEENADENTTEAKESVEDEDKEEKLRAALTTDTTVRVQKHFSKQRITKHDIKTCNRRNTRRVMDFKSSIQTGDGDAFDMQLPNSVYNVLKQHSITTGKRMARLNEKKKRSTAEGVFDETSKLIIFKLINRGILEEVNGAVNTGKESNVYHGIGGNEELQVTLGEVAIKVYKTTLNEFRNRASYVVNDFRFNKQNPRKIIHLWAEKEMFNLIRIRRAGIPCPEVVMLKKHVLVMTFIGNEGKSAPTLKEAELTEVQVQQAYDEVVEIMKKLWTKCELVHADLSEFNLLWHLNRVWVIDVSQSVLTDHPNALLFLLRDCCNITNFFSRRGANTISHCQLFTAITGKLLEDGSGVGLLSKIDEFERNEHQVANGISACNEADTFDQMFAKSVEERKTGREVIMPATADKSSSKLGKSPKQNTPPMA